MSGDFSSLIFSSQQSSIMTTFRLSNFDTFISYEIESSYGHLISLENSLKIQNCEYIVNKSTLQSLIKRSVCGH